jgi:NodT family efflux transporter outer membrane factor (OMF) lipoprotein
MKKRGRNNYVNLENPLNPLPSPFKSLGAIAMAAVLFTGCSLFEPETRPGTPLALPAHYQPLYTQADPGPGKWWQAFGSEELNTLVGRALSGNFDIRTALAKVRQAEAAARKAGADLSPSMDYGGGAEKNRQQTKTDAAGSASDQSGTFSANLSAGYELDLWGRLQALHTSEILEYDATREDLEAAAVTVAADVVTSWVAVLSLRRQIAILENQIRMNRQMLKLQELRFLNGRADTLAVSQQREALAQARAVLPTLQQAEEQQRNALAVLLGRAGAGSLSISQATLPKLIPLPKAGLPADLLATRPDVRAAGLRLKAVDWQVSAARADRLPSLTLSAEAAVSSSSLDLLFSNWVATLAAAVTGPLFDGERREAEVDRARAEADQILTAYARTVAQAVQEVEDSLISEKRQGEYLLLLTEQLEASRLTVKTARIQYMNGQDNYLSYLTAWTSAQSLERQLVEEQATQIKNRITLYRTLGGDWTQTLISHTE